MQYRRWASSCLAICSGEHPRLRCAQSISVCVPVADLSLISSLCLCVRDARPLASFPASNSGLLSAVTLSRRGTAPSKDAIALYASFSRPDNGAFARLRDCSIQARQTWPSQAEPVRRHHPKQFQTTLRRFPSGLVVLPCRSDALDSKHRENLSGLSECGCELVTLSVRSVAASA